MMRFIVRRTAWMFLTLLMVSLVTFFLMHKVPGGPFDKEKRLPEYIIANLNKYYHLDRPVWKQYLQHVYDVMVPRVSTAAPGGSRLDEFLIEIKMGPVYLRWMNFGPSYTSRARTVNDIFREQLPVSFQLAVMSGLFTVTLSIPLGILAALKHNIFWDYAAMGMAVVSMSVPTMVLGVAILLIFGVWLKVLPISGWGAHPPYALGLLPRELSLDYFTYGIMPALVLGLSGVGYLGRMTHASLLEVLYEDYIRAARAKGLPERSATSSSHLLGEGWHTPTAGRPRGSSAASLAHLAQLQSAPSSASHSRWQK